MRLQRLTAAAQDDPVGAVAAAPQWVVQQLQMEQEQRDAVEQQRKREAEAMANPPVAMSPASTQRALYDSLRI